MAIRNLSVEILLHGQLIARGVCHLVVRNGPQSGTISQLRWTGAEPQLAGREVVLRLDEGERLDVQITRHTHAEAVPVLRFKVIAKPASED